MTFFNHFRTACRLISLAIYTGNSIYMMIIMNGENPDDVNIKNIKAQQYIYLTVWNLIFQMLYLCMSLVCDSIPVKKTYEVYIKTLDRWRNIFFDGIVWPCTLTVFVIFWPVFLYNREIIYPTFMDEAIGSPANYLMHLLILPVVLLELIFTEGEGRREHYKKHYILLTLLYVTYLAVVLANYYIRGLFPYPFLEVTFGTLYFPLILLGSCVLEIGAYYVQWPFRSLLSRKPKNLKNTTTVKAAEEDPDEATNLDKLLNQ